MGILQMLGLKDAPLQQLPTVPTDTVYPCNIIDDKSTLKKLVLVWSFKFNDVLDADQLHDALVQLCGIGEWKKLGARVRLNGRGKLEYHIPEKFTASRPAVVYTHKEEPMNIADHPAGKLFYECDGSSRTFTSKPELAEFGQTEQSPKTFSDYLTSDHPLIGLRITSFKDATIVGLVWPHHLMDIVGYEEFFRAWCLVLAGKHDQVARTIGATVDPAWEAGDPSKPAKAEWNMLNYAMSGFGIAWFTARIIWGTLFGPRLSAGFYVMTKKATEKLVKSARAEANGQFISEGDILTAWVCKMANKAERNPRGYNVVQVMNLRKALARYVPQDGPYVANLWMAVISLWSADFLRNSSVGQIAVSHRKALEEQGAEDQVMACVRCLREEATKTPGGDAPFQGYSSNELFSFTSWTRSKVITMVDFSPAVIRAGDTSAARSNPPGTMTMFDHRQQDKRLWMKGANSFMGKDHDGNMWLWSIMTDEIWEMYDLELRRLDE